MPGTSKPRKHDGVAMQAMKALVAVYGPREAARVSGIPSGTVLAYASKHKWKKAAFNRPANVIGTTGETEVADVLVAALEKHRQESTLHLAEYTANASRKAAEHKDPLDVARKVRDVAGVFSVLYPPESESSLIEGAILIGEARVTPNPEEMLTLTADVRMELPDAGPKGD
jgi:hypothetical protein